MARVTIKELEKQIADKVRILGNLENACRKSDATLDFKNDKIRSLEAKMRGQHHTVTDLKDRNKILQSRIDKCSTDSRKAADLIKEQQQTLTGLRKNIVKVQDANNLALHAIELGIEVFYKDVHYLEDATEPLARLLLIAAGRLDEANEE